MLQVLRYELGRGLAYRSVRHPNARIVIDGIPLALAVLLLVAGRLFPVQPALLGKDGLFSAAMSVLSTLPGFYFAGLAAVATFSNAYMDLEMPAPAPEIDIVTRGQTITNKLTRRQYLSYLFSYLVVLSLVLCFVLLALNALTGSVALWKSGVLQVRYGALIWEGLREIVLFPISYLLTSLLVVTLHGVFFLTERIHQP